MSEEMQVAIESRDSEVRVGDHVVQFYAHDSELVEAVGPYLTAAAHAGEVAIVIAAETHRRSFEAELESGGINLERARADGLLISLDADATMAKFMAHGRVDCDAFHATIGELVRRSAASGRQVRAYGEMVALLWDAGNVLAAIELETLWNELACELAFSLFCSYPARSVSGWEHAEALHSVCRLHSRVIPPGTRNTLSSSSAIEVTGRFPAERDSPRRARHTCVAALRKWGHQERLVEDAALVLSELATNAIVHAGSSFSMVVRADASKLRIAVRDGGLLRTVGESTGLVAQTGHGLGLIELIATRWGVEHVTGGKVVWAELRV